MRTNVFEESGVRITFNASWVVRKYDAHTYYQGLAGAGLRGVDYLGLHRNRELVLFELKNYLIFDDPRRRKAVTNSLSRPQAVAGVLIHKLEDTFTAIRAIRKYYLRNPWYRWAAPLLRLLPWFHFDWIFWTRVFDLYDRGAYRIVLWLEAEEEFSAPMQQIAETLRARFAPVPILIANHADHPFRDSLSTAIIRPAN